jgi:hypothetical protein
MRKFSYKLIFLVSMVGFLQSCLELAKPDNQIVVIGNGAKESSKTVVVDVSIGSGAQSFIIENQSLKSIDDKLSLHITPAKDSNEDSKIISSYLDWIARFDSGKTLFQLRLDGEMLPEASQIKHFEGHEDGPAKEVLLQPLDISHQAQPSFLKNGAVIFLDSQNNLQISFDRKTSEILAKSVSEFYLDAKESLYFLNSEGWFLLSRLQMYGLKSGLKTEPQKFFGEDIFYVTDDGSPIVYILNEGVGISKNLKKNRLYAFDSDLLSFKELWPAEQELLVDRVVNISDRYFAVQGRTFIFRADMKTVGERLIALSPQGIEILPVEGDLQFSEVQVGEKRILVSQRGAFENSTSLQICEKTKDFQCGSISALKPYTISSATLGIHDQLFALTDKKLLTLDIDQDEYKIVKEIPLENILSLRFLKASRFEESKPVTDRKSGSEVRK